MYDENPEQALVGKNVTRIRMSTDYLVFDTDQGYVGYTVEGDCCSRSYFYDMHGADKLLANGPVVSAKAVDVALYDNADGPNDDFVQAYGFEFVTEHPDFGEMTTVLSFRNASNGYYGGWMEKVDALTESDVAALVDVNTGAFTLNEA